MHTNPTLPPNPNDHHTPRPKLIVALLSLLTILTTTTHGANGPSPAELSLSGANSTGESFSSYLSRTRLTFQSHDEPPSTPCLAVMPSYTQNSTYANTALGEPLVVWGRLLGGLVNPPYTYNFSFGDGTPDESGSVTDPTFIATTHSFASAGQKTMTLTVTDDLGAELSNSAIINVIVSPTHDARINMAIEKGLLWLYRNQLEVDSDRVVWNTGYGGSELPGATGGAVLCFEENGHLPNETDCENIYAETVRRGLNWLLDSGYGSTYAITPHDDGSGNLRDSDSNSNGQGLYLTPHTYANGYAVLALVLSHQNAATAMADLVTSGPFAGMSYYDVVADAIDQFSYAQGDNGNRGGWVYNLDTPDDGRYDGSAQQWPALVFRAAIDRWGLMPQTWMLDNAVFGYQQLQNPTSGGAGYSDNESWLNAAKTGGMLVCYDVGGKAVGDADVDAGLGFIGDTWYSEISTGSGSNDGGWLGELYAMYGVKKGLQLQDVTTVNTPSGVRDWYLDMSAWLLGNAVLLDSSLGASLQDIDTHAFGQHPDGSWTTSEWPLGGDTTLNTVNSILVLTKAVTVDVPVAVIAPVGDQSPTSGAFQMDGSGSYHTDPATYQIVQYLWDFDAADGLDFDNPDATGPIVSNPGYTSAGPRTVTLRVRDNASPSLFDQETIIVNVITDDLPPVAVAIPETLLPAYAGKPGDEINLDGSASFDPDGDTIILYEWDTDGDGQYDDETGVDASFSQPAEYSGQVGLRVTANGKSSSNTAFINVFVSTKDLYVESLTAPGVEAGVAARVVAVIRNDPTSTQGYNNVVVRFYNGNPFTTGTQIGSSYLVNLPIGASVTLDDILPLDGATEIHCFVDATSVIPEWDERNNVRKVNIPATVRMPGDINGDFCISLADVTLVGNAIKSRSTDLATYDANGDGRINALDLVWIKLRFDNPNGAPCND